MRKNDDKRAKCSENLANSHWRHAKFRFLKVFSHNFVPFEFSHRCLYMRLSLGYYFATLQNDRASNKSTKWWHNINKKLVTMARFIIHVDGWILWDPQFCDDYEQVVWGRGFPMQQVFGLGIWSLGFAYNNYVRAMTKFRSKDANGMKWTIKSASFSYICVMVHSRK